MRRRFIQAIVAIFVAALTLPAGSLAALQEAESEDKVESEDRTENEGKPGNKGEDEKKVESLDKAFLGLSIGSGLSVTYDTGIRDRVTDAVIDANGFVRVNKKENARARVMFETHYFVPLRRRLVDGELVVSSGWGPFVAAQPGENEIINAVAIGVMFGWRRLPTDLRAADDKSYSQSFNLGIGFAVDPNTQVLGDEFHDNELAPLGPDGSPLPIRFQERDQGGLIALASFSW